MGLADLPLDTGWQRNQKLPIFFNLSRGYRQESPNLRKVKRRPDDYASKGKRRGRKGRKDICNENIIQKTNLNFLKTVEKTQQIKIWQDN